MCETKKELLNIMEICMHHFLLRALPLLVSLLGVLPPPTVLAYTFTTIQVQDAVLTEARGINSRGELVGFYADGQAGLFHGFVAGGKLPTYSTSPVPVPLASLASMILATSSAATSMATAADTALWPRTARSRRLA